MEPRTVVVVDGLPRSLEVMQTYDRMQAAFPGEQFTADIVLEGRNLDQAQLPFRLAPLRGGIGGGSGRPARRPGHDGVVGNSGRGPFGARSVRAGPPVKP